MFFLKYLIMKASRQVISNIKNCRTLNIQIISRVLGIIFFLFLESVLNSRLSLNILFISICLQPMNYFPILMNIKNLPFKVLWMIYARASSEKSNTTKWWMTIVLTLKASQILCFYQSKKCKFLIGGHQPWEMKSTYLNLSFEKGKIVKLLNQWL